MAGLTISTASGKLYLTSTSNPLTITSAGSVTTTASGDAIDAPSGTAWQINNAGTISGVIGTSSAGIYSPASGIAVQNTGKISGYVAGLWLSSGGTVTNGASGLISATGSYGVYIAGAAGVVTNLGTITGSSYAVDLTFSSAANRVVVAPGAVFNGLVSGGNGTLELASGAGSGSLTGLNTGSFKNFAALVVDAGASWTLSGSNTIASVTDDGSLVITGALPAATYQIGAAGGGGTLEVASAPSAASPISFLGNSKLIIDSAAGFGANIGNASYSGPLLEGFVSGDTIDIKSFSAANASYTYNSVTGLLQVVNGSQTASLDFQTSTLGSGTFSLTSDGGTGLDVTLSQATAPAAPTITSPGSGSTDTTTTEPVISGGGVSGDTVTISIDGTQVGTAPVSNSAWSFTPTSPLSNASHTVTATQAAAGGPSSTAATDTFTVNVPTAPAAPTIASPASGSTDTTTTEPVISGGGVSGDTVTISIDGTQVGTALVSNSAWSYTPTSPLSNASHTVTATQAASGGPSSTAASDTFTVNVSGAGLTISSAVTGPLSLAATNTPLTITGAGSVKATASGADAIDGGSGVAWSINNSGSVASSQRYGISLHGAGSTVVNSGSISGYSGAGGYGLDLDAGGTVTNTSTGYITGGEEGIIVNGAAGTINNSGQIVSTFDDGVSLFGGGSVINDAGAVIQAPTSGGYAVYIPTGSANVANSGSMSGQYGVYLGVAGTVYNSGTISGSSAAVDFAASSSANLLQVHPRGTFTGSVNGDGGTIHLLGDPAYGGGVIGGISNSGQFYGFQSLIADVGGMHEPGSPWTLTGSNSIANVTVNGGLAVSGSLDVTTAINAASTGAFDLGAGSVLEVTAATGSQTAMDFLGASQLAVDNAALFGTGIGGTSYLGSQLENFGAGDSIDIHNFSASGATLAYDPTSGLLQLANGGELATLDFQQSTLGSGAFNLASDGGTGLLLTKSPTTPPAAPTITNPANNSTDTTTATPTISGGGVSGDTVTVSIDGNVAGTAPVVAGAWTFTPPSALSNASHTITATQAASGGPSSTAATDTFTVNVPTAPAAPTIASPANGSTDTTATPTISGGGVTGDTVTISIDGTQVGTALVSNSAWSYTPTSPLSNASHTVTATQAASGGPSSTAASDTFTVNVSGAGLTISSAVTGPLSLAATNTPLTITGAGSVKATASGADAIDGGSGVAWSINNSGSVASSQRYGISLHGAGSTVVNSGSISGYSGAGGYGLDLDAGGTVTNTSTGYITGGEEGIIVNGAAGTINNSGQIVSTFDDGVSLFGGGSVINDAGAVIQAPTSGGYGPAAVYIPTGSANVDNAGSMSGQYGVYLGVAGTVYNSGTISGSSAAVDFAASSSANLLQVHPRGTFTGSVNGDGGTIHLLGDPAYGGGVIGGISNSGQFYGFQSLIADVGGMHEPGSPWTLTGSNSIANVTVNGGLAVSGSLDVTTAINAASTGAFDLGAGSVLEVTAATGSQTAMDFLGASQLAVDNAALFGTGIGGTSYLGSQLENFGAGDSIDIHNFSASGATLAYDPTSGLLQLANGGELATLDFQQSTLGSGSFHLAADASGSGLSITRV